jgi:mono/diheme cytochrome c family protein
VFFFVEITAALLYLYGWEKLDARLHEWYGWMYFIAAFLSMVIINGIITFMLTSGNWVKTHEFWQGFFNPTYFPSLAFRFAIALALAGIYALITASVQQDAELKARLVRWSACWIVPALVVLPALGWWYIRWIPADVWANARGAMPTATHYAFFAIVLASTTFVLALLSLVWPGRMHLAFSLLVALVALGAMGSFEFVREAVRKPYVISKYLYANSLYAMKMPGDGGFSVDEVNATGILKAAKWINQRDLSTGDQAKVGREIFRVECESCHTIDAYRGVKHYLALRQWDLHNMHAMLGSLDLMHNGVMPPFAGTDAERAALAAYLNTVQPNSSEATIVAGDGRMVFDQNCSMCHRPKAGEPLFKELPRDSAAAIKALKDLTGLFPVMPDLKLSEPQRVALVQWIDAQRPVKGSSSAAPGGSQR